MEEQEAQEGQEKKREPLLSRSTILIIVAFALINVAVIFAVFGGSIFGGKGGDGDADGVSKKSILEDNAIIDLGRIEVSKPLDPTHQSFIHCSANVALMVPSDRQQELEPKIKQNDAIFKELAREAFRNASPTDIATENLAGVKNAIQRGINDVLGEDIVEQVYFSDYRPY